MNMTYEQAIGVASIAATAGVLAAYLFWNMVVKKRRLNRIAYGDMQLYKKDKGRSRSSLLTVFSTTPQVTSEACGAAIATVTLAVTLLMGMEHGSFEYSAISLALVAVAIAAISYIMSMEQLTVAMSPSITVGEKFRLYKEAIDLKTMGFFMLWGAVLIAMLMTTYYVVMITCVITAILAIRHYSRRWLRKDEV